MREAIKELGIRAKAAEKALARELTETSKKNEVLKKAAEELVNNTEAIIAANDLDMERARKNGMSEGLLDRLFLDEKRVKSMAEGLLSLADLPDPIGEVMEEIKRPNGLVIKKVRVPVGVIGII